MKEFKPNDSKYLNQINQNLHFFFIRFDDDDLNVKFKKSSVSVALFFNLSDIGSSQGGVQNKCCMENPVYRTIYP